jgi:GT2 family glycosyltransferase
MSPRVLVSIVTYNSARYLRRCLESLKAQSCSNLAVCLWDNASDDASIEIASDFADFLHSLHASNQNVGFCAAHNRIIDSAASDYVLVLNPDVVLEKEFIDTLVRAMDRDRSAGSATGKLWRWYLDDESGNDLVANPLEGSGSAAQRIIDTTGIYFTPTQRHFDRGAGETDCGQYEKKEYVFGASGAAAFYRREMLEAVKAGREYFDENFFAYREDADLAWRAQWLGWTCLYVPEARACHVRQVLPERRSLLPPDINMHSFKNRFLLRVKNMDVGTYARFFFPITVRDLGALAYVFVCEPSSLRAIPLFFKSLPQAWSVRKALQHHRRVSPAELRTWFSYRPVARLVQNLHEVPGTPPS